MNEPTQVSIASTAPSRVPKICKNPRKGYPKGCGKRYQGFAFLHAAPLPILRRLIVEDETGEVWGLCDACIGAWQSSYAVKPPEVEWSAPPTKALRAGDRGDAWENP